MNEIRVADLFGGIGGFRLGLESVGAGKSLWKTGRQERHMFNSDRKENEQCTSYFRTVWYCEIDKYAVETYNKNFKEQWEPTDITKADPSDLPDIDMLCGGFPCQSFSIAGKRKGFQDTRGTLFFEICRIAKEKKPGLLFLENVKGLLSHDEGNTFARILKALDELGYDAEWQVLNSKNFGVPQNRERVFIIGHLRTKQLCRSEIFPIGETGSEDVKELRYVGAIMSESNKRWLEDGKELSRNFPQGQRVYGVDGIASNICGDAGGLGGKTGLYMMESLHHHRTGEYGDGRKVEESFTSDSGSGRDLVVNSLQPRSPDRPSLKYSSGGSGHLKREDGYSYCLDSGNCQAVELMGQIRRLTPIECERLQGFPDDWTSGGSDTQRYKQLGNAVTVNVIQAIASRIIDVMYD